MKAHEKARRSHLESYGRNPVLERKPRKNLKLQTHTKKGREKGVRREAVKLCGSTNLISNVFRRVTTCITEKQQFLTPSTKNTQPNRP